MSKRDFSFDGCHHRIISWIELLIYWYWFAVDFACINRQKSVVFLVQSIIWHIILFECNSNNSCFMLNIQLFKFDFTAGIECFMICCSISIDVILKFSVLSCWFCFISVILLVIKPNSIVSNVHLHLWELYNTSIGNWVHCTLLVHN